MRRKSKGHCAMAAPISPQSGSARRAAARSRYPRNRNDMLSVKMPQKGTQPPAAPRILEIGDASLMIAAFPETTEFYSTRDRADISAAIDPSSALVLTFPRL